MGARLVFALTPFFLAGWVLCLGFLEDVSAASIRPDTVIHQRDGQTIVLSRYRGRWVLINY